MTDDEKRVKCLEHERDVYRKALIRLVTASDTGGRKTIDKAEVHAIACQAYDRGNAWHRHGKGEPWESTVGALR